MTFLSTLDQMGNGFRIFEPPQRIVSLVPSQTELLFDLGLDEQVVGVTKFCIYPKEWRSSKSIVGGTKNFNFNVIDQLKPDLLIGNKEENYQEGISKLQQNYPVWMSDITTLGDAMTMIRSIARITNKKHEGIEMIGKIHLAFNSLNIIKPLRTLYLMWRDPWMGVGNKTFINSMIEKIGLKNVLESSERYPELSVNQIKELNPSIVLLSSEPFPFSEKHTNEVRKILPNARILLVDGEMFSWYGSRMAKAPNYFNSIQFEA